LRHRLRPFHRRRTAHWSGLGLGVLRLRLYLIALL
jgi:hypothetical protein